MKTFRTERSAGTPTHEQASDIPRGMRDLAALATLPSIWVDCDVRHSLQNLTDVLRAALKAFTVGVRVELPNGRRFDAAASNGLSNRNRHTRDAVELLDAVPADATELVEIPRFNGSGPLNALPQPIFFEGRQIGYFAACFKDDVLPSAGDRLLLHVAASQVMLLLQRQKDQEERLARRLAEERLRQTEHHYQQLVQSLPAAVYTCDNEGRITLYNEAAAKLWGRRPKIGEDKWCGSWKIFKPDGSPLPLDECPMAIAIREGRPVRGTEIVVERPDGTRAFVLPHPDPIRDEDGKIVGTVNMLVVIDELKRVENALRASESRLQSLLNLMPAAVYACDAEGRITFYNRRAAELWGSEPSLNDDHQKFCAACRCWFNGKVLAPADTPMAIAVREGRSFRNLEPVFERPDGTSIPVLVNIDPILDANGQSIGAINVFQDVTALKNAEAELKRKNTQLAAFLETAAVGLHRVGPDGTILWANDAEMKMLGYAPEEYVGHHIAEFHADPPVIDDILKRLSCGQTLREREARLRCKDGTIKHVLIDSSVLWEDGKFIHTQCFTRDVTDRKRAEEALRDQRQQYEALVRASSQIVWTTNATGEVEEDSPSWRAFTGQTFDEWKGFGWLDVFHPDDKQRVREAWLRAVANPAPLEIEYRIRHKDGDWRWTLAQATPISDSEGNVRKWIGMNADITDRKRAEERLRKRGERLQLLSETLGQLLSARDPETIVRELFPKVAAHLGVDTYFNFMVNEAGDALTLHSCAGIPDETARAIGRLEFGQAICGTVAQTRQPIHATDIQHSGYDKAALVRGFGIQCYACNPLIVGDRLLGTLSFASRTRPAFDEEELQFLSIISQYTAVALEQLKSSEQLRESEERFRAVLDNSTTVIYVKDCDGKYLLINERYAQLFHIRESEILGKTDFDYFPAEVAQKFRANDLEVIRTGQPIEIEEVAPHDDGLHTYISIKFPLRKADGAIYGVAGISTDITERKRAQESTARLAAIVEHSDDAIFSTDLNGIIKSWNSGAEHLYGYTLGEAMGQPVTMLVPEDRRDEETRILNRIRQGQAVENYETLRRRKDGSLLDISLTVSPVKDESGHVIGISKVARDITDKVRAKEKLEQIVAERTASLKQAIAQMEEFSYSVSHDLRAPVRSIEGYARILEKDCRALLPPHAQGYLEKISRSTARMNRLINDVLTLSRVAQNEIHLHEVALRPLIEDIIEQHPEMQPPRADIRLGELHSVVGDDVSLSQAISNLLSNAVKFVAPGVRPQVKVRSEERGSVVRVWVEDNGIGIKPELQSKLFGMFQRLRPNDGYDGTGIGLAIVRKAVERMGGAVGVESDGTNGSRFWINLKGCFENGRAERHTSGGGQ